MRLRPLFTTAKIGRIPFWGLAVAACLAKFVLYGVGQTIVPIGTPLSARLSLYSDLLCLGVALLAMCRARDAGVRGLFGFLGGLFSFFGVGVLLILAVKAGGVAIDLLTVNIIAVVPQITQLLFVWRMSGWPTSDLSRRELV